MRTPVTLYVLFFLLPLFETNAQIPNFSYPVSPHSIEIIQPDNTIISIIGKGTMINSWTETLDGYSIVKNRDGIYEYAQENNGQLFPSGFLVVENVQNLDKQNFLDEQAKHLRPKVTNQELLNSSNMRSSESDGLKVDLSFPKEGTHKILVLLIDFPDLVATHTVNEFEDFMNQENYNGTGSLGTIF